MRWYKDKPWMVERPIASYHSRYPRYYGKIDVINESDKLLKTKEFLNLNLDENRDHLSIEVEYHIHKPNKILFKITSSNFIESISGDLTFTSQEFYYNKERCEGTFVNGTISALTVISLPPRSEDCSEYEEMLIYFGHTDAEFLEGKPSYEFRAGQQCIICNKGRLQVLGKKEHTKRDREFPLVEQENIIEVLVCDTFGKSFENVSIRLK
jgi:hypothetical protein